MEMFEAAAPALAQKAVDKLLADDERSLITHLIVTTCTGFSAPGIDLELVQRCGLPTSVERTIVGFMGCYAAINALKLSRHIVRSDPKARVLIVNIELCTLHLRETTELEKLISFCLWGDGCAASLVTAEPHGILLESFHAIVAAERRELMSWHIRDDGFDMVLSGQVPGAIRETLRDEHRGYPRRQVRRGDRSVGGASGRPLGARRGRAGAWPRPDRAWRYRARCCGRIGNMSSATVMFVMAEMLKAPGRPARLRHGVRAGIDHGNHDVPDRVMSELRATISLRHIVPEILDGPGGRRSAARLHSRRDLVRVNALMFNGPIMAGLLRKHVRAAPRRILEIGAGDGNFMLAVARRLAKNWPAVELTLLDRIDLVSPATRDAFQETWLARRDSHRRCLRMDAKCRRTALRCDHRQPLSAPFRRRRSRAAAFRTAAAGAGSGGHRAAPRQLSAGCGSPALGDRRNDVTLHDAAASVRAGFAGTELSALWPAGAGKADRGAARLAVHPCFCRRAANDR